MKKVNKEAAVEAEVIEVSEIKASRFEIEQQLNNLIGQIKVKGMSNDGKLAIVKLKIKLSAIMKEIEEFRKTTIDNIEKPEKLEELKEAAEKENATDEIKDAFKEVEAVYNQEFAKVAIPYYNDTVNIAFDFLTESDFDNMVINNDLEAVFGYEYLYSKLVK